MIGLTIGTQNSYSGYPYCSVSGRDHYMYAKMNANNDIENANEETRQAWDANAAYWDEKMGEGNDFVNLLQWPAILRLLDPQPGQRILDIATGNGLTARRLAAWRRRSALSIFPRRSSSLPKPARLRIYPLYITFWMPPTRPACFPTSHPPSHSTRPFATWRSSTWPISNHFFTFSPGCSSPAEHLSLQ